MLKPNIIRDEDLDPQETAEWLEALGQIVDEAGPDRAAYLLKRLLDQAAHGGIPAPANLNTPYLNTIPVEEESPYPGDRELERRIKSIVRWNALAMVVRANKYDPGIGGHISTYASLATLVEVDGVWYWQEARPWLRRSCPTRAAPSRSPPGAANG